MWLVKINMYFQQQKHNIWNNIYDKLKQRNRLHGKGLNKYY